MAIVQLPDGALGGLAGSQVALVIRGVGGPAAFVSATYAGRNVLPPDGAGDRIVFEIQPGRNTLFIICAFSETATGAQLLDQRDGELVTIMDIAVDAPSASIGITGLVGRTQERFGIASPAPLATPIDRLWRRPHMDLSTAQPLGAGQAFRVSVYADQSDVAAGEVSSVIDIMGVEQQYDLEVRLLATAHFRVQGPSTQPFRIERSKIRSADVTFDLTVADAADLEALDGEPASLCAAFRYQGRPAGKVLREIAIQGAAAPAQAGDSKVLPPAQDAIACEPGAKPADLTITITSQSENDSRHFWCAVQTDLLPEYKPGVTAQWVTSDVTSKLVAGYMQAFTAPGLSTFARLARLRGAGRNLFAASPDIFQEAFWKLIDAKIPWSTLAVVSSEPFVPWELMIPHRETPAGPEERDALGVEYRVGRMTRRSNVPGRQKLPVDRAYVVAPQFQGPENLPFAQEEAKFILDRIPGDPIDPATLESLNEKLESCRSVLHFACHGEVDENGEQKLALGNDEEMSALELCGMPGPAKGIPRARPLVFLNACEVGRPLPALVGVGGLAPVFTELGAGAVIAPLWSVKDSIAHEIATTFYDSVSSDKTVPFSEVLRRLRKKAYETGEDTYAAYCFYGDPLAAPG